MCPAGQASSDPVRRRRYRRVIDVALAVTGTDCMTRTEEPSPQVAATAGTAPSRTPARAVTATRPGGPVPVRTPTTPDARSVAAARRSTSGATRVTASGTTRGTSAPASACELPEEVPIALVCDGETFAVMLATPADLEDFAIGFTLTEGLSTTADRVEIVRRANGIECRLALDAAGRRAFERRRRATTGGSSCGLCGVRALAQAVPVPPRVGGQDTRFAADGLCRAVASLRDHQPLHDRTHAAHAAGFFVPGRGLVAVREDVGRHNALDKLVGAVARAGIDPAAGAVVLTSRVSIEMVQKSAALGAAVLLAVSAPTALAVRTARATGITLVGNVRGEAYRTFAGEARLTVAAVPPPSLAADPPPAHASATIAEREPASRARTGQRSVYLA